MSGCVAFVSLLGGSGQTTLLANIADVWATQGQAVLAIDLSAQNALGQQCGLEHAPTEGWATSVCSGRWWGESALENAAGLRFLPYGALTDPQRQAAELTQRLLQPKWLRQQMQQLALKTGTLVMLDVPNAPGPMASQALTCADLLVVSLDVSPRAVAVRQRLQALLRSLPAGLPVAIVLTRFNPRREAQIAAMRQLREHWPQQLSPHVFHDDESVPLGQAEGLCVTRWAPHAQSAHDVQGIAQWLLPLLTSSAGRDA